MNLALLIVGIILFGILITCYFNKINIIKLIAFSLIGFSFLYIILSGCFLFFDKFSILNVLISCDIIQLIFLLVSIFILKKKPSFMAIDFSFKKYIIPIIISILVLPITFVNFGFFGMGQDQGVYQTKAIELINGNSSNIYDFKEYQSLDTADQQEFFNSVSKETGFYLYDTTIPNTSIEKKSSPVAGIFHGIPTYSAILALYGSVFGLTNMMSLQTVIFILCIFVVFFICENLKFKSITSILCTTIFAFSPVVLWVSKSSLTEMFTALMISCFLFFITNNENDLTLLSSFTILTFSFFHISVYTLMPVFILIYICMYIITNNKLNIMYIMLSTVFYLLGFIMMTNVNPLYSFNQFAPVFHFGIDRSNISVLVYGVCGLLIVLCGIAYLLVVKKKWNININISDSLKAKRLPSVLVDLLLIVPCIGVVSYTLLTNKTLGSIKMLSLSGFIYASGIFPLILALIIAVIKPKLIFENKNTILVFVMFYYCVIVYSAVLRRNVEHYYYYSRYLVPFMPVVVSFCGIILNKLTKKITIPIGIASLLIFSYYDFTLATDYDDTKLDYSTLSEISQMIDKDSTVIIDEDYSKLLYFPVKSITGCNAYFSDIHDKIYSGNNVFYITSDSNFTDGEKIYSKKIISGDDDLSHHNRFVPFTSEFVHPENELYIYKIN